MKQILLDTIKYYLKSPNGRFRRFLRPPGHFQPVLAMKFLVESEFQGQGPPRTQEIVNIDMKK